MHLLAPGIETLFGLPVPLRLCGMNRGGFTDYETSSPGLGYSVGYGSQTGEVTLYVYDGGKEDVPLDLRLDVVRAQFESELSVILAGRGSPSESFALRKTFEWTTLEEIGPDFLGALFDVLSSDARQSSGYLLGSKNGKFVKLRVSSPLDSNAFDEWFAAIGREYVGLLWPERVERNNRDNFQSLVVVANQGDARAQLHLAEKFLKGDCVERDLAQANFWTMRSALQGFDVAQYNVGISFAIGDGVAKDAIEAAKWYRLAAEQGNADAQFALGYVLASGNGLPKDAVEAVKWYRMAADQGHTPAQTNLGFAYSNGIGVEQNLAIAIMWYRRAAEQGNTDAQQNLADAYRTGRHVAMDLNEALRWYHLSANGGNVRAQNHLGVCYATGDGVAQDALRAFLWFHLAVEGGFTAAATNRAHAYSEMTPAQSEEAVRMLREIGDQDSMIKNNLRHSSVS